MEVLDVGGVKGCTRILQLSSNECKSKKDDVQARPFSPKVTDISPCCSDDLRQVTQIFADSREPNKFKTCVCRLRQHHVFPGS